MRLRGRQARFLLTVLGGWTMARGYFLWPIAIETAREMPAFAAALTPETMDRFQPAAPFEAAPLPALPAAMVGARAIDWSRGINAARLALLRLGGSETVSAAYALSRATFAYRPPAEESVSAVASPAPAALFPQESRPLKPGIEAQAYLFWRPGAEGSGLADHGELGGSQLAARIAVPIGHGLAAAARVYAPLEHGGAEAAVGLDWHPLASQSLRIGIERRQRLDRLGRSAWSTYAAGGFWRGGGPGSAQIDGYAQAGVVGAQRRDLFIDGALRIGYRLPTPNTAITLGAGLWGAAQPQVARLDAGPRMAIVLPVDHQNVTLAIDGRFRLAGHAAPESGAALTLGADF